MVDVKGHYEKVMNEGRELFVSLNNSTAKEIIDVIESSKTGMSKSHLVEYTGKSYNEVNRIVSSLKKFGVLVEAGKIGNYIMLVVNGKRMDDIYSFIEKVANIEYKLHGEEE